jgi:hypothetical protein
MEKFVLDDPLLQVLTYCYCIQCWLCNKSLAGLMRSWVIIEVRFLLSILFVGIGLGARKPRLLSFVLKIQISGISTLPWR